MITLPQFTDILRTSAFSSAALCLLTVLPSCRPDSKNTDSTSVGVARIAQLHANALTENVSSLTSSQASSDINWQIWDKSLFAHAKSERKTVFALIGSGTDTNTLEVLNQLNASSATCTLLNEQHVNVLIDSNVHPDLEFYAAVLCSHTRAALNTPIIVWFSYEGNPISWTPVSARSHKDINELIARMSNTVYRVWRDDPDYVLKNSRNDYARRKQVVPPQDSDEDPSLVTARAIRQAASLFDPTSQSIDGLGKLTPARYIEMLAKASISMDLPASRKKKYLSNASLAADHILLHGLIDPLDGGVYSGIKKTTSALPLFSKNLQSQAYTMKALYSLYQATGKIRYLHAADDIGTYTENKLTLPDGGYREGVINALTQVNKNPCLWTLEDVEKALTPEEARVATAAFGLKGLGNIPLVDDPDRTYFRKNTISWKTTTSELSNQLSIEEKTLQQRLESITKKLSKLRTERTTVTFSEKLSTAESTALYASALIQGHRATANPKHLETALKAINHIKDNFFDDAGNFHRARYSGRLHSHPATAADYAVVIRAALDLHEVTLDQAWLGFAHELHQRMNSLLADADNLSDITEYDGSSYPQPYNTKVYYTLPALDNTNTWAIAYSNAKRLTLRIDDEALAGQAEKLNLTFMGLSSEAVIAAIDYLTETATFAQSRLYLKAPVSEDLLMAACQKPCQIILVNDSNPTSEYEDQLRQLEPGQAMIVSDGQVIGSTSSPTELDSLFK